MCWVLKQIQKEIRSAEANAAAEIHAAAEEDDNNNDG